MNDWNKGMNVLKLNTYGKLFSRKAELVFRPNNPYIDIHHLIFPNETEAGESGWKSLWF